MEERRHHRRESLAPYTEIFPEDGSEPISGYPTDMSLGGLALESDVALPEGGTVNVAVHFGNVDEDHLEDMDETDTGEFIQARVVRVEPLGERHKVSVAFIDCNETTHATLYGVLQFIDE